MYLYLYLYLYCIRTPEVPWTRWQYFHGDLSWKIRAAAAAMTVTVAMASVDQGSSANWYGFDACRPRHTLLHIIYDHPTFQYTYKYASTQYHAISLSILDLDTIIIKYVLWILKSRYFHSRGFIFNKSWEK